MARSRYLRLGRWAAVLIVLAIVAYFGIPRLFDRISVTEEDVETAVVTTLQREAPASFYVTGTLDLTATTRVANTKVFMPRWVGLSLGTSAATVRLPGRALYGFNISALDSQDIQLHEDGRVDIRLPQLSVYAVDPNLSEMEVRSSQGWSRALDNSERDVQDEAVRIAEDALTKQAEAHLSDSDQPAINTARALQKLLRPVLQAAGVENPRISIRLGPDLVIEPQG